jgi:hypothetical protein
MVQIKHNQYIDYDWTHERPGEWMNQAACIGKAELFMVKDREKSGGSLSRWNGYDPVRLTEARVICMSCPVFYQCETSATPEDFAWTVRAGRLPSIFNTQKSERPVGRPPKRPNVDGVCRNGHVGMMRGNNRGRYCSECARLQKEAKRRAAGIPERTMKTVCKNGHEGMYKRAKSGKRICVGCRRERQRKSPAKIEA